MTRIIAGRAGGRRLAVPAGRGTRPTSERVREAVFSRLDHLGAVQGARVLDLYAGSGALGLEALSRGAAHAVLVEASPKVAALARRNAVTVGAGAATVLAVPVARALAGPPAGAPVDLVFADPPYDVSQDELAVVLDALAAPGRLAADAVVVVERSARCAEPSWPPPLRRFAGHRYGDTRVWLAEHCGTQSD